MSKKLTFTPKSIIGFCLASPPMRMKHTTVASPPLLMDGVIISPGSVETVTWYGPDESYCKYCGKPWAKHNIF